MQNGKFWHISANYEKICLNLSVVHREDLEILNKKSEENDCMLDRDLLKVYKNQKQIPIVSFSFSQKESRLILL